MREEPDLNSAQPPIGLASATLAVWRLPFTVSLAWWHAGLDLALLSLPHSHLVPHHDEQGQLVVPEPIEEDGEHALFA
ncbi:hypothetical protein [Sphingobium nicotianae]|uniref:Uncharacterized protein n=1 Tax=Sphingobium nicotianae TaxID=2782607 RepID=A0A9X1DE98_9SPHN|nr:hypothetical protein [Sphingobium nicotianae]MBT2188363.1 hypothetical protein [Sphingobium nicotianae]